MATDTLSIWAVEVRNKATNYWRTRNMDGSVEAFVSPELAHTAIDSSSNKDEFDYRVSEYCEAEELREAISWMSAASDFRPGGKAYEGWLKIKHLAVKELKHDD